MKLLLFRSALAISAFVIPLQAMGFDCTGTLATQGTITFSPPVPTSSDIVTVRLNVGKFSLTGLETTVKGNTVDIAVFGFTVPVHAPVEICETFVIGPLPPGHYVVNLLQGGLAPGSAITSSVAIGSLTVLDTPAGVNASIPALQPTLLVTLAILIALAAVWRLRANPRRP